MKPVLVAFVVVLLIPFLFTACLNDKADMVDDTSCDTTYFAREINPIIQTKCAIPGCHDGSVAPGNYKVFNDIYLRRVEIRYRINLPLNDPAGQHMPQGDTLSPERLTKLNSWLDQGAIGCQVN